MLPDESALTRLASADSPRGEIALSLRRTPNGDVLELRVNGVYVMDTHETSSEEDLARYALEASTSPRRVLVGGLGLGFTAAEVLRDPRVEELVVVEVEGALIAWMRDGTIGHGPALFADPRLHVIEADIRDQFAVQSAFDLVVLDVDNGPDNLVHESNTEIYRPSGLAVIAGVLTQGGIVAIWSAAPSPALAQAMRETFGSVTERACPVHRDTHATDYYLYTSPGRPHP